MERDVKNNGNLGIVFTAIGIWFVVGFVLGGYLVWLWNPWDDEGIVRGLIGLVGGMILFSGLVLFFISAGQYSLMMGARPLTRNGKSGSRNGLRNDSTGKPTR